MAKKIGYVLIGVFATLGVLFLILMLIPDDGEDTEREETTISQSDDREEADNPGVTKPDTGKKEEQETASGKDEETASDKDEAEDASEKDEAEDASDRDDAEEPSAGDDEEGSSDRDDAEDAGPNEAAASGNTVTVSIPKKELSDQTLTFKTASLDNKKVTEKVFSDYDLTVVHMWGTYCQPCIGEMDEYAKLYRELPDNVNLIAIVCDVYDGIDNNVSEAYHILDDAGAGFTNLRISDDLYEIVEDLQYVPSSFFVDRDGHLIGEMMDGAGFDETKERLNGYLK
ncbi:MAG: redoxin domain-containing protein [Lachnospiraceae bacterium]|nr:redoxin domain-containing protein [Lachnospiraceae bacterium]